MFKLVFVVISRFTSERHDAVVGNMVLLSAVTNEGQKMVPVCQSTPSPVPKTALFSPLHAEVSSALAGKQRNPHSGFRSREQLIDKIISKPTEMFHQEWVLSYPLLCHFSLLGFSSQQPYITQFADRVTVQSMYESAFLHGFQTSIFPLCSYTFESSLQWSWNTGIYLVCFIWKNHGSNSFFKEASGQSAVSAAWLLESILGSTSRLCQMQWSDPLNGCQRQLWNLVDLLL